MLQELKEFIWRGNLIEQAYNRAFPKEEEAAGPTEVELLAQIRDELRRRRDSSGV